MTYEEPNAVCLSTRLPDGDYAIVEVLGHRTYVGRITEVERFGSTLMQIEPAFEGRLLDPVLIGGGSIYQFTPCSRDVAEARQPKHRWQLPASVSALLPPDVDALPAPDDDDADDFAVTFLDDEGGEE